MKKKPTPKTYHAYHLHSTDCLGCKTFLMDHRPQIAPPIVHTVDRPVEKIVYRYRPLWQMLFVGSIASLLTCIAFDLIFPHVPDRRPYPVYINRVDPSIKAKLEECQADWQSDQVTKKLLQAKIKRLEIP